MDLTRPLEPRAVQQLHKALGEHGILLFRDAALTPQQHIASPVEQPMIRTHPVTGRKALYVNPGFTKGIAGMPKEETQPILEMLFAHSTRPEFVYRHKWKVDDLVFWDNRCTMHYALADYDFSVRRHMHRTTIAGYAPY